MDDIHKVQLQDLFHQVFAVGPQCRPLAFRDQNGTLALWYETALPVVHSHRLTVYLVGTGQGRLRDVPEHARYLGTTQTGGTVYHCYWEHRKV